MRKSALLLCLAVAACGRDEPPADAAPAARPTHGFEIAAWPLPIRDAAAQPDLAVAPQGRLLLSWIRRQGDRHALQYAAYEGDNTWQSAPKTIAVGRSMFVNWADTPHIAMTDNGALWAHWLQKSADAPYAYDVMLTQSQDDGMHWLPPTRVHDDGTATEHGFVALWPAAQDTLGIAWLDGRNTAAGADHGKHAGHAAGGAPMTLRATTFGSALQRGDEAELDASVCDCCQTDVAMTARGPLLVYRDRTADEIRDIHAVRLADGKWSAAAPVHRDNWKMPACPVNGPAVDARGESAVVAWYTAPNGVPAVKFARSADAGTTFAAPVVVDRGAEVLGRVDVALDANAAWVLWLREEARGQSLWLARYTPDLARETGRVEVATPAGRGRATGFPQLALRDGVAYVVWTEVADGQPGLRGAVVAWRR